MNGFLNHSPGLQQELPLQNGPQGHIRLDPPHAGVHLRANSASPTWAHDFQNVQAAMESAFSVPPGTQFSAEDMSRFQQMTQPASSSRSSPMPTVMMQQQPMLGAAVPNYSMMNMPMYQQPLHHASHPLQRVREEEKGKGKAIELDDEKWEEQFAALDLEDGEKADEAAAIEKELEDLDMGIQSETNELGDFESIWKGIQAETAASRSMIDDQTFDGEFTDDWSHDFQGFGGDFSRLGEPIIENYLFEEDNILDGDKDAFEKGVQIMKEGGNLSLAALAFEAAVQQNPEHVEAWVYLGTAQAQNEKETAAIRALQQALKLDPSNLAALMGLAVSYTNEGYDSTAYRTLERWLSVKYPQIISPIDLSQPQEMGFTDRQQLHQKVTEDFIKAAQLSPDGERMDPDVQVGLGVLFYNAEEYDKAVDCFQAALHSSELGTSNQREQVHLLWNRLGATLANSGRSEEAIAAYEEALRLHPNFVRARYNLGVSCINIGCHHEAAAHFLAALDMHKLIEKSARDKAYEIIGGKTQTASPKPIHKNLAAQLDRMTAQNRSTTLYDTLRRVFTQMGRRDLADKVVPGVDLDIFRPEFDF
jgi:peroxin-5